MSDHKGISPSNTNYNYLTLEFEKASDKDFLPGLLEHLTTSK